MTPETPPKREAEDECFEGTAGADVPKLDEGDRVLCNGLSPPTRGRSPCDEHCVAAGLRKGMPGTTRKRRKHFMNSFRPCSGISRMSLQRSPYDTLPDHPGMGPCDRAHGRWEVPAPETLSAIPGRAGRAGQVPRGEHLIRPDPPVQVPLWPHPSSSSKRRMDRSGRFRITDSLNSITVKNKYPLPSSTI